VRKINIIFVFSFSIFGVFSSSFARTEEWLARRISDIENSRNMTRDERLEVLGNAVRAGYPDLAFKPNSNQLKLSQIAFEEIKTIPGYADYFDSRIREHLERAKKHEGTDRQFGFANAMMDNVSSDFKILTCMPSPEAVGVLGELLSEDWVVLRNGQPFNRPRAGFAMSSLHRMPLASKPVQGDYVSDEKDLETYRLWYSQIKAGNRTFRFEGDPNEYTLAGPIRESPDLAATPPKASDSIESVSPGQTGLNPSTPWYAYGLGGVLIGSALWYWLASRRKV
jgi:hypothetical protein